MQDAFPQPSDLKLDLPAIYMMDPTFQSITDISPCVSQYSILGFPSFTKGITIAEVLGGIRNEPRVRTNVAGTQGNSVFWWSKTAAVEESLSICWSISLGLPIGGFILANHLLIAST